MSDPNTSPGGGSSHESWNRQGSGGHYTDQYAGQYQGGAPGQARQQDYYQGQYPGQYQGQYPAYGSYGYGPGGWNAPERTHGMTTFAMVTGIVAATISIVPVFGFAAFLLGPLAMVLGIVGIAKRLNRRGFSVTALVTGAFGLLVSILYALLFTTLMSFIDRSDTYEFVASSTGEYQISLTTTEPAAAVTSNQRGTFTESHIASTLFGGVIATNVGDNDGIVRCEVFDSEGYLVIEDEDEGIGAQAQCMIGASWLENTEDYSVSDELKAMAGN
ncbi:hypothetical protein [Paeniglutamicibacter sp. NPDC091659]|uniref:hypothetical protein n=1 Tax=Paeniglutamicibacter sp. NPDC091659 TaxID=3364389 RepID=UPI003824217F